MNISQGTDKKQKRKRVYTLWDAFLNADFTTYPTQLEGFGNQYIESVLYKKPVILTPYPVYKKDIKTKGFRSIEMDEKISLNTINKINKYIKDTQLKDKLADDNFELGKKHYSYEATADKIKKII